MAKPPLPPAYQRARHIEAMEEAMRSLVFFFWSLLEHLHTLKFATDLAGIADLDGQTLLLLTTLGITLMTYRKLDQRNDDRPGKPRRRTRR